MRHGPPIGCCARAVSFVQRSDKTDAGFCGQPAVLSGGQLPVAIFTLHTSVVAATVNSVSQTRNVVTPTLLNFIRCVSYASTDWPLVRDVYRISRFTTQHVCSINFMTISTLR